MKVEPTGVVMMGICDVQTPKCKAKELSAITAVWTLPGRSQVNVCGDCLEEMVRAGEWEIPRSKISRHADVAVLNRNQNLALIIEVKKRPYHDAGLNGFSMRVHRNLVMHSGIPPRVFFMLALFPSPFFLWLPESACEVEAPPDFRIDCEEEMARFGDIHKITRNEYQLPERFVADWVSNILASPPPSDDSSKWLYGSGLFDAISKGKVMLEYRIE